MVTEEENLGAGSVEVATVVEGMAAVAMEVVATVAEALVVG